MTWTFAPLVWLPAGWLADVVGAPATILASGGLVVVCMLFLGYTLAGAASPASALRSPSPTVVGEVG